MLATFRRRALPAGGASGVLRTSIKSGRRCFAEQSKPATPAANPTSTLERLEARLPRFLGRYVTPLRTAPVSHITAFLILHEITAIIPVFGLAYAFHAFNWLPPIISEGAWVKYGTEKIGKWARNKGLIKDDSRGGKWFGRGEAGVSMVVCIGAAYAVTKALLPLRIILSVWGTPWFARWTVLPVTSRISRLFGRNKAVGTATKRSEATSTAAAGTGAVGGGAIPKDIK